MENFEFFTPTKIFFGQDQESNVGSIIKSYGFKKVLVHYGGQSAKRSGLLDRVYHSLDQAQIAYVSLGGVVPNPRLSLVETGIKLCKDENVELILAVGGGSVIDSAKAIGLGVCYPGPVWDLFAKKLPSQGMLPVGCILTIAAAGSEMSHSTVITNEDGWLKRGYGSPDAHCLFSIMNPELTMTLPPYQTAAGITDIMMHTLERYFTHSYRLDITDSISESLFKTVMKHALILKDNPTDYTSRAEIMWCGTLSHNGLTNAGSDRGDWATHQLEHELSGMFDVTHGAGLAAVWGSWARYVMDSALPRFKKLAINVFDIKPDGLTDHDVALKGIEAMEHFFTTIDMPISISGLGINLTDDNIENLALKLSHDKTTQCGLIKKIGYQEAKDIYQMAR